MRQGKGAFRKIPFVEWCYCRQLAVYLRNKRASTIASRYSAPDCVPTNAFLRCVRHNGSLEAAGGEFEGWDGAWHVLMLSRLRRASRRSDGEMLRWKETGISSHDPTGAGEGWVVDRDVTSGPQSTSPIPRVENVKIPPAPEGSWRRDASRATPGRGVFAAGLMELEQL